MQSQAVVQRISLPKAGRTICISDIHGNIRVLRRLLEKARYTPKDTLILLGDLYTKGPDGFETLRYIIDLCQQPGVFALRGNCDWIEDDLLPEEKAWLENLPHIIESDDFYFVHGGLPSENLTELDAFSVMKNDNFPEQGKRFSKWVMVGHWPTVNCTHAIPCCNPIVDEEHRIIAIDGGNVIKGEGQMNAFIIQDGVFDFVAEDDFEKITVLQDQSASENPFNITWVDRFVERVGQGTDGFSLYRHLATGRTILLADQFVWQDDQGRLCGAHFGFDCFLPLKAGEEVALVKRMATRLLVKKDGVAGWLDINNA